ncbi:MAG: hypothetical protein E6H66_24870 [Betaproteobacteria bacterium]|nr:MAG: hypothetical protein E6H66_24870 [Betaproteobacteria bacterium]
MNLGEILERTLPPMGYELVDWDSSPRSGLLRVFIDKPNGVDVEDCARVSNHLTHLLAVEQIAYDRLEVSSPGLDRPLKRPAPAEGCFTRCGRRIGASRYRGRPSNDCACQHRKGATGAED